jgi:asparagine synthase (glutamine-hydrolysing)
LFGGYERYRGAKFSTYYQKLPKVVTRTLIAHLAEQIHEGTNGDHRLRRLRTFAQVGWQPLEDAYLRWVGYFSEDEKADLYTPEFAAQVKGWNSADFLRERFRRGEKLDPLNRLGYVDLTSYLTFNCLEYSDRMSMANSMEVRCPLTDQRLVEFAFTIPAQLKLKGTGTKWILRASMADRLPKEILQNKKKGFTAPVPQWINGELDGLVRSLLSRENVKRRGIFRPSAVATLIDDHSTQRRDNSYKIWALLMLELWFQSYMESGFRRWSRRCDIELPKEVSSAMAQL